MQLGTVRGLKPSRQTSLVVVSNENLRDNHQHATINITVSKKQNRGGKSFKEGTKNFCNKYNG